MSFEVTRLPGPVRTIGACEGLLAGVHPIMSLEFKLAIELLAANRAPVVHVLGQGVLNKHQLVERNHLAGRGRSLFKKSHVVVGAVSGGGNWMEEWVAGNTEGGNHIGRENGGGVPAASHLKETIGQ